MKIDNLLSKNTFCEFWGALHSVQAPLLVMDDIRHLFCQLGIYHHILDVLYQYYGGFAHIYYGLVRYTHNFGTNSISELTHYE